MVQWWLRKFGKGHLGGDGVAKVPMSELNVSGALLDGASLGDVISSGWLIVIVVGCSSVIDVEMVGARNSGALVGTVALLLTAVAGDVIEKSSVSSRSCLHKSHPFSCCWVVGGSVVPIASGVVV